MTGSVKLFGFAATSLAIIAGLFFLAFVENSTAPTVTVVLTSLFASILTMHFLIALRVTKLWEAIRSSFSNLLKHSSGRAELRWLWIDREIPG